MIKCRKCDYQPEDESELDAHHIIPKFMGGTDKDGRIYLCRENRGKDCHRKLHKKLRELIPTIKKFVNEWLNDGN